MTYSRVVVSASVASVLLAAALPAQLVSLDVSSDVSFVSTLGTLDHDAVLRQPIAGPPEIVDLGTLPAGADVTAFQALDGGLRLFSLDSFAELPGGVYADSRDVVQYDGATYSVAFHGGAAGVPAGAAIDAIGRRRQGGVASLLLSFDVTVALPGGLTVDDEDVAAWDGATWSLAFDGSALGIPGALDVDGIDRDPVTGTWYVSFDGSGRLDGVDFDDEDVLSYSGGSWSLAFAGAGLGATFAAGDLDSLGIRTVNIFRDGVESGNTQEWSAAVP